MRLRAALALVPLLLLPVACGNDKAAAPATLAGVTVTGKFGEEPTVKAKDLKATKAQSVVLSKGDGPKVALDKQTLVNLVVASGVDGKTLFSTWQANQPVPVGNQAQEPIKGLNKALEGVARGSRVAFDTPASGAVSDAVLTQLKLSKDDSLVVVADIVSVEKTNPLKAPSGTAKTPPAGTPKVVTSGDKVTGFDWAGVGAKPSQVQVIPLIEGSGPAIEKGRLVTFNYFGELFKGTKAFDESFSRGPATFAVGVGGLIPAWDESLIGVKEGSRVLIISPPDKAYGAAGSPPSIPKNATLAFVIDVLGVDG